MKLLWSERAWADYLWWQEQEDADLQRVNALIKDCTRTPFVGLGKPEPLKGDYSGWWSRRVTREHRLVYRITGKGETQTLEIAQCRFHY